MTLQTRKLDDSPTRTGPWWSEMTRYHWWVVIVSILGWLFDSMDQRLFVLARTPALRELLGPVSDALVTTYAGYATCIFILGWATGGLFFGYFGDRWGRTKAMMVTILVYSIFTGLSALSRSWYDFATYRFICGMGIGGEYAAGVALVAETVPSRARPYCLGMLQSLAALGHVAGSSVSLFIGPQAEVAGLSGWRWLFLIGVIPSLLVVLIRFGVREPDRWITRKDKSISENRLSEMFGDRMLRKHLLIGMTLGFAGQVGIDRKSTRLNSSHRT